MFKYNKDGSPVNNDILQQFDKQRSRGTQGFGLFSYTNDRPKVVRDATENGILSWLVKKDSPLVMFHHRFPTSTKNVAQAAHPITTGKYFGKTQYILVHNGVIYNDESLFTKHQELGIKYSTLLDDLTFNDSESLLWEFALTMEGQQEKMDIQGDLAFVCAKLVSGKLEQLYFGRNGRPLHFYRSKRTIELSSEGRGNEIAVDKLYTYDYKTDTLRKHVMHFAKPYQYNRLPYSGNYHPSASSRAWGLYRDDDDYRDYPIEDFYPGWVRGEDGLLRRQEEAKKEPNQLEKILRTKFPQLFDTTPVTEILSEDTLAAADIDLMDDQLLDMLEPSSGEIQRRALDSLNYVEGNFEGAYWLLENEYSDLFEAPDTMANVREKLLLEAAMEFIQADPEYVDITSTSSLWRNVCSQQQLAR